MTYDKQFFKDHVASLIVDNDYLSAIKFAKDNLFEHSVTFTFDKKSSSLSITGDWLPLVATNYKNCGDMHAFYDDFAKDIDVSYFIPKIRAFSDSLYYYNRKLTYDYLIELLKDELDDELTTDLVDIVDDLMDYHFDEDFLFGNYQDDSLPYELRNYLTVANIDYYDLYEGVPRRPHEQLSLYLMIYKLAYEQLFK